MVIRMSTTSESLRKLGLTDYESKALIALIKAGSGTAVDIHILSGIPRSAVYGVLEKLKERGIIEIQNTKPKRYKSINPARAIQKLKNDYENESKNALEQLESMYETVAEEKNEEVVWTINGVKNVTDKMIDLINDSQYDIILVASYTGLNQITKTYPVVEKIGEALRKRGEDGIKVRITGHDMEDSKNIKMELPFADVRVDVEMLTRPPIKGGMIIVDDSKVLITIISDKGAREDMTAIWSMGKQVVSIFKYFVDSRWNASEPIK